MERTYIADIKNNLGKPVLVQGFVENLRDSKYMAFIVLKDISGKIQITVEKEKLPELCPVIASLTQDSVISVVGTAVENDFVKMGGVEIIPESITAESIADALPIVRKEIPATKKRPGVERSSIDQRIDYRWIDLRTDENQLMFKVQTAMVNAMREFLIDRNFIEIHTPKLIGAASESGAEVLRSSILTASPILRRARSSISRWPWRAALSVYLKSAPFSEPRSPTQISTPPSSPALTLSLATSPPSRMS